MLNSRQQVRGESSRTLEAPSGSSSATANSRESGGILIEDMSEADNSLHSRPEWQLARRIASSKRLHKSDLLPKFLMYVTEQQLLGAGHEITEQRIGTHIFNRPNDYNPGEDNIVRSYARLLRKRLEEYFNEEGSEEQMRIVIPRGGYVPVFSDGAATGHGAECDQPLLNLPSPKAEDEVPYARQAPPMLVLEKEVERRSHWRPAWPSLFAGLLLGVLLASAWWFKAGRAQAEKTPSAASAVWAQLFQRNRNTLIVPADSGLGILQNLTNHLVSLEEYANGTYLSDVKPVPLIGLDNLNDLRRQRYTSVVDLNITAMLTQLPEFAGSSSQIRYARSITTEDLKHSNAILLGSVHTNPWVSLFEKDLNFKLEYTPEINQSFVRNEHPVGTEQTTYLNGTAGMSGTYGVIDYLPNLDGTGHVLIIQGLNMAATQAAADILFNARKIGPILKEAKLPDGSLKPFELLIETSSIDATAPSSQIVATRFHSTAE